MGVEAPKTCWATHKRQIINLWKCCIWLVNLFELYDNERTCQRQNLNYCMLNCLFCNVIFQLNSQTIHFRMCLYDFLSLFWCKKTHCWNLSKHFRSTLCNETLVVYKHPWVCKYLTVSCAMICSRISYLRIVVRVLPPCMK
jgi:hypothetical protein